MTQSRLSNSLVTSVAHLLAQFACQLLVSSMEMGQRRSVCVPKAEPVMWLTVATMEVPVILQSMCNISTKGFNIPNSAL